MASLPPLLAANTVKLDPEFRKLSAPPLPFDKKNYSTKEPNSLSSELKEAVSTAGQGNNRKLESSNYFPILQECILQNSVSGVESIHSQIIKSGFVEDLFLMTFLVNVYAKCWDMGSARKVFDNLPKRNAVAWTSLMSGYIYNSRPELAISIFKEMLEAGAYPTNYTLGVVLNACTSLCDINLARQIHGYIVKYDLEHDSSIGNALCSLYSKCRNLAMAIRAFERIAEKDVISWTAVVSACGDNGNSAKGLDMFVKMLVVGAEPNEITLTSVLSLCCTMQALDAGSQVHSLIIKLGYGSDLRLTNSIMYLYLKSGCIAEAKKLFVGMSSVSLVTWNAMIAGYAEMISLAEDALSAYLCGIEALQIFQQMNRSGLRPDLYTFSSLFSVCSSLVALEQGEQVHAQTIKTGFLSDVIVATALVNMYNKCGSINRASKAFLEMSTRTLISWTSMITAFAQHGRSEQALQVFEDMRRVGVKPNKITFVGVLSACSQAGMVDQAFAYYDMMKNEYRISPVMDHYSCLIDMFVRLDRIDEAFDFIEKANLAPNEFIWSILIAGCRSQGKLELAFHAAEQLLELELKDSETYLLLLNMYVSAGRWKDVSRVRKMMRDAKVDRIVDWSWITIRDKVYSFKFSSKRHHQDGVTELLDDLIDRAKPLGYKAEAGLEIDDELGKEEATTSAAHHSEKMAVAFGLLNTSGEVQIRVTKNMGMCRDCHCFIKLVSLLTSRTIIIRDSKRLHKFHNGECSCKDFGGLV
ncbi:pentatricopeptide repeat-containing protein At3g24000, mitochondrial-like [Salvia miltiorrhiza]|uniref:pentatricopeptide repeat-containing protein At3g24000, mitochondrial-like n=1 Tax=Salvia miltiorrhiza TaxID=226208 RepID=UPI0025AC9B8E|nr:pentatricopeptide repeat-containing protein At3g24000, mitochondrial-like [Salvia miltiorrhiza]